MKRASAVLILLLAVVGFGLQPTRGKAVPVDLSALRGFPLALGAFRSISNNDDELTQPYQVTDGSQGLERYYVDPSGRKFYIYIAPQTIGQHVPVMCYRYGGYSSISETQQSLPGDPSVRFNRMLAREDVGNEISNCIYFWKTADGIFVPRPHHSLGMIAVRWANHEQGLLVKICAEGQNPNDSETEKEIETLLRDSYPEIARLYPAVFRHATK